MSTEDGSQNVGADDESQSAKHSQPDWLTASEADFAAVDLNEPVLGSDCLDCREIGELYRRRAKHAEETGRNPDSRVYAMLSALCSFHFKPNEANEPFGPLFQAADRRSAIPDDFRGTPQALLDRHIERVSHPTLRARIGDTLWLLDKSNSRSAELALSGYLQTVRTAESQSDNLLAKEEGADAYFCAEQLRRALQIAWAIGWDRAESVQARELLARLREQSHTTRNVSAFRWFVELDFDFRVSPPEKLAAEAELLVTAEKEAHGQHHLWEIAARANRAANDVDNQNRCRIAAAECLVSVSGSGSASAMYQAHWLEQAIAELSRVPGTQKRRKELKHRLIDVQEDIADEMHPFSHEMDLSELVAAARTAVAGKPFMEALRGLALVAQSPMPDSVRKHAKERLARFPLQALVGSTVMDRDGKPIHRYSGTGDGTDNDAALQRQVAQEESFRRTIVAMGSIEPARQAIMQEHSVTGEKIRFLCEHSPFVPESHGDIYGNGLARFFQGDMTGALHVLVPQLENSIRYVLRARGHDVTKMNNDMTQEDLNLSVMLDRLRIPMHKTFGPALVADIDSVFNHRGGPAMRHQVAHGRVSDGTPFSPDSIYACWMILRLCCLPLLPHWQDVTNAYSTLFGHTAGPCR